MSLTRSTPSTTATGLTWALVSAVSFGFAGPFAKSLLEAGWSPGGVAIARVVGSAFVLLPFGVMAFLRHRGSFGAGSAGSLLAYGVVAVAGVQLCFFNAVQRLPVGIALLIEYTAPVLLVVFASVRGRKLPSRTVAIGAVVATAGLLPVLDLTSDTRIDPVGVAWAVAAAIGLATFFVISARSGDVPPVLLASAGFAIGGAVLAVAGATGLLAVRTSTAPVDLLGHQVSWTTPALLLILVCTLTAYLTSIAALGRLGERRGSFVALTEVLFAILASWLLLSQVPTPVQAFGAVVVLTGVVLVQRGAATPPPVPAVTPELAGAAK